MAQVVRVFSYPLHQMNHVSYVLTIIPLDGNVPYSSTNSRKFCSINATRNWTSKRVRVAKISEIMKKHSPYGLLRYEVARKNRLSRSAKCAPRRSPAARGNPGHLDLLRRLIHPLQMSLLRARAAPCSRSFCTHWCASLKEVAWEPRPRTRVAAGTDVALHGHPWRSLQWGAF